MGNLLNPETPETPVSQPVISESDLRAARESGAREMLQRENERLIRERYMASRPAEPDQLKRYVTDDLLLPADEKLRILDAGTRQRVRDEVGPALGEMERRHQQQLAEMENKMALNSVLGTNPDMAADPEGFAAAMTRATYRAQQQGMNSPDAATLTRMAVGIYREGKKASDLPVLEGSSRPDAAPAVPRSPEKPKGPSPWEQLYGKAEDDVEHEEPFDHERAVHDYVDGRLENLERQGFVPEDSGISLFLETLSSNRRRKKQKAAVGG